MRFGIHAINQRRIIKFLEDRRRVQFFAMLGCIAAACVLLCAFVFFPIAPAEKPAVALAQRDNVSASAFLVGNQLVLTTARLVGTQTQVFLTFPGKSAIIAKVAFTDADHDIALLQSDEIDPTLKPLPLGNSDSLTAREELFIVGYPAEVFTKLDATLIRRTADLIETDAAASPGNIGAPLFRKLDDTVVGMMLSTQELGGGTSERGGHRALSLSLIDRICQEHQKPIR